MREVSNMPEDISIGEWRKVKEYISTAGKRIELGLYFTYNLLDNTLYTLFAFPRYKVHY